MSNPTLTIATINPKIVKNKGWRLDTYLSPEVAQEFQTIKADMAKQYGRNPSKPVVIAMLMKAWKSLEAKPELTQV